MELLFLYLKKYGNINEKCFNLNPRYRFELVNVRNESLLCLKETPDYLNIFNDYNKRITNVTAIVGENGAGKTTLLNFLMDFHKYQGVFSENNQYVIVFLSTVEETSERFVMYTNSNVRIDSKVELQFKKIVNEHEIKFSIIKQNFIYYSEAFNALSYVQSLRKIHNDTTLNLSIAGRLIAATQLSKRRHEGLTVDPIQSLLHWETECQVRAFEAARIPFKISGIIIKPIIIQNIEYLLGKNESDEKDIKELKTRMSDFYTDFYTDIFNNRYRKDKGKLLLCAVLPSLMQFVMSGFSVKNPDRGKRVQEINGILDKWDGLIKEWSNNATINNIMEFVRCVYENEVIWIQDSKAIISSYESALTLFSASNVRFNEYTLTFYMSLTKDGNQGNLMNWFLCYDKSSHHGACPYLSFEWGMSTGERSYFNFFAHLHNIHKKIKNKKEITLMVDEADLYLHPKWQQNGVKMMMDSALRCFPESNIQIIFATHSPLFLSDVPVGHVIFLDDAKEVREGHEECFAANIYNLYKDSFFLDKNNIWVQGTFAHSFIRGIQEKFDKWEKDISKITDDELQMIKRKISIIGEELLKRLLLERWGKIYMQYHIATDDKLSVEAKMVLEAFSNLKEAEKEIIRKRL